MRNLLVLLPLAAAILSAQAPSDGKQNSDLFRTVTALDQQLFDAYNRCDLPKFGSFIDDDVEFYHDQGGITLGRQKLTESIRQNICHKVRRELVPGSLKVYPMKGYGALEIGVHRFYQNNGAEPTGVAQFVHLWQNKDGAWKITRVMSFDHQAVPPR